MDEGETQEQEAHDRKIERAARRRRETVDRLVQAALDVMHHDRDEDGPETTHNRGALAAKFSKILGQ